MGKAKGFLVVFCKLSADSATTRLRVPKQGILSVYQDALEDY
jgi:hypothetical protein